MKQDKNIKRSAFTLIELLLVVAIISLLSVAVFVALNPAQRLSDTKNAKRSIDVDTILSAIHQSIVDNKGTFPTGLSSGMNEKQLGNGTSGCTINTGGCAVAGDTDCVNLMAGGQNLQQYMKENPIDPVGSPKYNASTSGYSVKVDTNGIVTVRSCGADSGQTIYVSR
jgi:prepilin-type N-terminal cleavage/methylation domain-containing protein